MNKLSKSAVVLIILAAAAIALGVVLFVSMPETWTESFGPGHWMERGAAYHHMYDGARAEGFSGTPGRGSRRGGAGFPFGILLAAGLIIFFITRRRRSFGHSNHGRAILDQMYAEEKISAEEYRRKRTIIEEEN